jgi:hypothetical protein
MMSAPYLGQSPLEIVFVTGFLGGGAAWLAGRAIARTWRPLWHVVCYMAILGAAVRFVHFALFDAELLSPVAYAADAGYVAALGCLSWRITRTTQMVSQYPWLYERVSLVSWRDRPPETDRAPLEGTA